MRFLSGYEDTSTAIPQQEDCKLLKTYIQCRSVLFLKAVDWEMGNKVRGKFETSISMYVAQDTGIK